MRKMDEATRVQVRAGRLMLAGKTPAEVAKAVGVARQTAYTWNVRLDEGGIDALRAMATGRPAQLHAGQLEGLLEWAEVVHDLDHLQEVAINVDGKAYRNRHAPKRVGPSAKCFRLVASHYRPPLAALDKGPVEPRAASHSCHYAREAPTSS